MKLFRFKKKDREETVAGEIVIIDDTPENLHLLNNILSDRGYKVRALPNGQMGLSACQASPPNLILLDITMPGMDGYEVARRLKAEANTKEIPIIFISAMSQTEDKVKAFRAGGVDYVTKPLQVEEVMARVETHLSISRMREQLNQANQKLLTWAVELSQPGKSAGAGTTAGGAIPEGFSECFGKPVKALAEGDRAEANLTVLVADSPSDETLSRLVEGLEKEFGGHAVARFSGIAVVISPRQNEEIGVWLEASFESDELGVSLNRGEGILEVLASDGGIKLDFRSPAILETLCALSSK